MRILLLNGSPRRQNTLACLTAFAEGVQANIPGAQVQRIDLNDCVIKPCQGCGACAKLGCCVHADDGRTIAEKALAADAIVFASPVYWWGISAQLKLAIDRLYGQGAALKALRKKAGVLIVGAGALENVQYRLIEGQFDCIFAYMGWEKAFYTPVSASAAPNAADMPEVMAACRALYKTLL